MKRLILFSLALFVTVSCGPYRAKVNTDPLQETEKIVLKDYDLKHRLRIVKHGTSKLPGGQLEVKVEIENHRKKDVWTDIQVIFRGADGFELENSGWEPFMFRRRQVTLYKKNSLNPTAVDYRIVIRDAKSN